MSALDRFQAEALPVKTGHRTEPTFWAAGLGGEVGEIFELVCPLVGLAAHAGRLLDVSKKIERDGDGVDVHGRRSDLDDRMMQEGGNVLFYLRALLATRGVTLEDAAAWQLNELELMRGGS